MAPPMCTGSALFPNPRCVPKGIGPHRVQQQPPWGFRWEPPTPGAGESLRHVPLHKGQQESPNAIPHGASGRVRRLLLGNPRSGEQGAKGSGGSTPPGRTDGQTDRQTGSGPG